MQRIPTHRATVASESGEGATQRKGFPPEAGEAGRETQKARANARALTLAPIIAEIQAHGVTRPHAIAAALTDRGVPTALGYRFWTSSRVREVLERLDRLGALKSASAQSSTSPRPQRAVRPLIDNSGTILLNTAGKIITFSQARGRGRPTAREIVGQILTHMRAEGSSLHYPHALLAKVVAARNNRALGDRNWNESTIKKHVREWLRENPEPNDYRVALTLKEAARKSGVKRSLLDVAIARGTLRAHKCGTRTLILHSDLQRFVMQFSESRAAHGIGGDKPGV
jgi:excisionase family DNA binding protein